MRGALLKLMVYAGPYDTAPMLPVRTAVRDFETACAINTDFHGNIRA